MLGRIDRSDMIDRRNAELDIALHRIALDAIDHPATVASFAPIDSPLEPDAEESAGDDFLLADLILHRSSWGRMDLELSELFRPWTVRTSRNATLSHLLNSRWPTAIERLPPSQQGVAWNELADGWLELGDVPRARNAVEHAEASGLIDSRGTQQVFNSTWRTWLALGDFDRSRRAADRASDPFAAAMFQLDIARALVGAGHVNQARDVIASALPCVRLVSLLARKINLLREIIDLDLAMGDRKGAQSIANEIASVAHQHDLFPASNLALGALAFSDLGDQARASKLVNEAIAAMGQKDGLAGLNATFQRLDLPGSLWEQIAVEAYHADETAVFDRLVAGFAPYWRRRAWDDLCDASEHSILRRPTVEACIANGGSGAIIRLAVRAAAEHRADAANRFLVRAVSDYQIHPWPDATERLLDAARVASVLGNVTARNTALAAAAKVAEGLPNPGDRETRLAAVKALWWELGA